MGNNGELLDSLGPSERLWHLSRTSLASGLSTEDLNTLCSLLEDKLIGQGETIYDEGQPATALHFLNRGAVRLSIKHSDGREKTVQILRGGDVFSPEAVGLEPFYQSQAVAHEESWISLLTRHQFLDLASQKPTLTYNLIQVLIQRLAEARDDIKALCFMDIEHRLVQTLLRLCRSHGCKLVQNDQMVKLKLQISHDFLARPTGSNRPYLSNIMSEFRRRGWVQYRRKHLLVNVKALDAFISQVPS